MTPASGSSLSTIDAASRQSLVVCRSSVVATAGPVVVVVSMFGCRCPFLVVLLQINPSRTHPDSLPLRTRPSAIDQTKEWTNETSSERKNEHPHSHGQLRQNEKLSK
eukprot:GHVU01150183.1.p1 GENE.GHVU01150183.1~~GHVU01150183.1.p1  ORF type:complete len:107 (+),score=4.96 GHVU01150183.1:281-601(+)